MRLITRVKILAGLLPLCTIGFAPAHADPLAEARQAIAASHAGIDSALAHKDPAGATAPCAPGFVSINDKGERFTAAQVRADLAHSLHNAATVRSDTDITGITLTPAGANAAVMQRMNVATRYNVLFVRRLARTTLNQSRLETWTKTAQGWRLTQSRTLSNISHTKL